MVRDGEGEWVTWGEGLDMKGYGGSSFQSVKSYNLATSYLKGGVEV